jgi:hypothetical protein
LERYPGCRFGGYQSILKRIYYLFRPLTNQWLRGRLQKFRAHNWRELQFPHWPVDTTVEQICENLLLSSLEAKGTGSIPFVWFWPRGAQGCVMMTHDVEAEAGRNFCADLMDLDDSFGIKASFQIVPEERYTVSREFLETIRSRGFEVGIQDINHDGKLFDDRAEFLRRIKVVKRYASEYGAKGFRAGVLYRKPEWYKAFDFSFDMSIPNVAHLDPQRGGCCTVMPYFIGNVLELPVTTTQDYTLFHLLNERSIDLWRAQVALILEKNGLASFIVHPDYVIEERNRNIYKDLLAYLRKLCEQESLWLSLPADVDSWWRERSQTSVVKDGNSWRIEGPGAERAVLAFAKKVKGKLVYEVARAGGGSSPVLDFLS